MKNFSELLDTELYLDVVADGQATKHNLHDHLVFDADQTVTVDGVEILPRYRYLAINGKLHIESPFYMWYHQVSGQGWLLIPNQG